MTEYREHLNSALWARIKSDAAARSQGLCELCKAAATETHHVKYPRGYATDSAENVLHVCSACHRRLHGMSQLVTDRSLVEIRIDTFKNRQATVFVDERRWVWASWEVWTRVLVIPASLQVQLISGIKAGAREQQADWSEPFELPDAKGAAWFRWHAIDDGLSAWAHRLRDRIGRGDASRGMADARLNEDEQLLYGNLKALRKWGRDLQERALSGAMSAAVAKAPAMGNVGALAEAMTLLAGVTKDHESRIVTIEQKVMRDPNEFMDAKSFATESGIASDRLVPGTKLTVQQWLGMELRKSGCDVGRPVSTRLEGTSRVVEVNTYRRRDLASALSRVPKA